jgi:hypothetical protein
MERANSRLRVVVTGLIAVGAHMACAHANLAARRVGAFETAHTVPATIERLARREGVRAGVACGTPREIPSVPVAAGTLAATLDKVTSLDPQYEWHESRGVVNVEGHGYVNAVLDTKTGASEVRGSDPFIAGQRALKVPEVVAAFDRLGLRLRTVVQFPSMPRPEGRVAIQAGGMTLREVLNEILRRSHAKVWVLCPVGLKPEEDRQVWLEIR